MHLFRVNKLDVHTHGEGGGGSDKDLALVSCIMTNNILQLSQ